MTVRPAQLVRELFLTEGYCQIDPSAPWRCLVTKLADGVGVVDDLIAVVEREDIGSGRYVSDSNYRVNPHVCVVVRAVGFDRGYEKITELSSFLDSVCDYYVVVDGNEYRVYGTKRTTNIQYYGVDATGRRHIHTIEYDIMLH